MNNRKINFLIVCLAIMGIFIFRLIAKKEINLKWTYRIGLVLSIVLYTALLFLDYNSPSADYGVFYSVATQLFDSNLSHAQYISVFTHYWGYSVFLGILFKTFGAINIIIVVSNIIINYLTAFILHKFLKEYRDEKVAKIGVLLYLLSPINIIWCTMCYNGILYNFFLMLTIYITYKYLKEDKKILFAILLGTSLGLANQFRPISIIFLIALIIYIFITIFLEKKKLCNELVKFVLVIVFFIIVNNIFSITLENKTSYEPSKNGLGFSLLAGSSLKTNGAWSIEASESFTKLYNEKPFNATKIQSELQKIAIEEYKENGIKNIQLILNKFNTLTTKVGDYSKNALLENVPLLFNDIMQKVIMCITSVFYYMIIILNLIMGIILFRSKRCNYLSIIILFIGGFTMASLALEVSPRYFLPMIVPLTILSTISLNEIIKKDFKRSKKHS